MKEHKTKIGKNLIGMLMFQMYGDSKLIYREYIQNSRDAINDAVRDEILEKITDGHISVNIDRINRKITISDNGTGVPLSDVESVLLDIADSHKDGETSAGQFGIGRLVGGYFCKKLSFKTSYKGEEVASEIVFDIEKIKAILGDDNDHREAQEVIDVATDKEIYDEEKNKHYFIVTLEDIHPDYPELLDQEIISEYLKEVAPIDYSLPFKNQLIATSLKDEFVELQKQVGHFKISVNDETSIKKRYGLKVEGTGDQIDSLHYFPLYDDNQELLAWGWYALTEFSKQIPRSDNNRCFRLRKHNIQVGDTNMLTDLFPRNEVRGNSYFYGEIHIVNQKIKLNSARDGLAPTPEGECLKQRIRDYFDYLAKLYYAANQAKKATEQIESALREYNNAAPEDLEEITKKCEEAQEKFAKVERSRNTQTDEAKKMLELYSNKITEIKKVLAAPDTQSTRVETPSIPTFIKPVQVVLPTDQFVTLRDRFSDNEIELTKRIFKSFTDNCPVAQKKLIEELKRKVIKDLGK